MFFRTALGLLLPGPTLPMDGTEVSQVATVVFMPDRDPVEQESQAFLLALFRLARCMRTQGPDEPVDLASMHVLQFVTAHPGIRVSELADHVGLDPSTLSRLTRNLEQLGYLERRPDPTDKRAAQMHISQSGYAVMSRTLHQRTQMVVNAFGGWPPEDRVRFVELGMKFVTDFEKAAVRRRSVGLELLDRQSG